MSAAVLSRPSRPQQHQAPRERPILFSGPMVRAILGGKKTQTRRVVSPGFPRWGPDDRPDTRTRGCPFGRPGDRLWVKETWARVNEDGYGGGVLYRADHDGLELEFLYDERWRPSIFMPRWVSRITLDITEVRVERLQDISLDDCEREGVRFPPSARSVGNFAMLWDSINGERAPWRSNPWVWCVSFRRVAP